MKEKIGKANKMEIKEKMSNFKKIKNGKMMEESSETKDYIKNLFVHEARAVFKHRTCMTRYIQWNYKNDPRYIKNSWKCNFCGRIDSESHILFCEQFRDLRNGKDLQNDKDLATYLYKVNMIRKKEDSKPSQDDSESAS